MWVRVCLVLALLLSAGAASAGWLVAETQHFRIHAEMREARIRQEAAVLEDFHALLELLTAHKVAADAPKLDIYLVESNSQMKIVRPGLSPWIAGFYSQSPGGIFAMAIAPTAGDMGFGRETLLHEYAHHFMMQAGNAAAPAWYVEGFAEYLMTAKFRPDRIEFGGVNEGRLYQLTDPQWVPLERILGKAQGVNSGSFYAQSWLLTHYLSRVDGMSAKRDAYLRKVAAGADPVEAFREQIHPDLGAFQSRLRTYLSGKRTYTRIKRQPPGAFDIQITALPRAADTALLSLVAVQLPQEADHDAANIAVIREAAKKAPLDPWVMRAVAIGEAAAGNRAAAAPLLDALLTEAPSDPVLLRWRARLYGAWRTSTSPADLSAARKLLVRANKAAPNDWLVLSDYVATYEGQSDRLPVSVLEVLGRAHSLAPQERNLARRMALALAHAGEYRLVPIVLAPLVNNPHRTTDMPLEQALLDAVKSGEQSAVEAALAAFKVPKSSDASQ